MKTINKILIVLFATVIATNLYALTTKCSPENGGTIISLGSLAYPQFAAIPYNGNNFVKWVLSNTNTGAVYWTRTQNPVNLTQSEYQSSQYTLTAYFGKDKYTIAFVNYDGTPLQSGKVEYGFVPKYTGATPTKPADEQYTYTFSGWNTEIEAVTGDVTYTATYTATFKANTYTIHVNQDCTSYMEE